MEHRPVFDALRAGSLAAFSAAVVYFGTWVLWRLMPLVADRAVTAVDSYETFVRLAVGALAANPVLAAWISAACSLFVARWFTRRTGVWT